MTEAAVALPDNVRVLEKREPRRVTESIFREEEYGQARFYISVPADWTFEDILKPECWASVAHKLRKNPHTNAPDKVGTRITVVPDDLAWKAHLCVRAVGERGLIVECEGPRHDKDGNGLPHIYGPKGKDKFAENESCPFKIRWNVGQRGYDIIRLSDNEIVGSASQFPVREQALRWIEETMKG